MTDRSGARGGAAGRRSRRRLGAVHPAGRRRRRQGRAKPNDYRETFVALANDKLSTRTGSRRSAGEHNLPGGVRDPADAVGAGGAGRGGRRAGARGLLRRRRSRRGSSSSPATSASWIAIARSATTSRRCTTPTGSTRRPRARGAAAAASRRSPPERRRCWRSCATDPKARGRVDRYLRGQARVRAVRAAQARLLVRGAALAAEPLHAGQLRPADARGAGHLGAQARHLRLGVPGRRDAGDAAGADARAAAGRLRRVLAERVADAAGIVEDGSINQARKRNPPTWRDAAGVAASGARSDRRSRERAAGRHRRADARAGHRVPARAQGRASPGCTSPSRPPPLPAYYGDGKNDGPVAPRSIAATSGTTCRSTRAASRSCSGAITTRT